jgi:hypothetical protein
MSTFQTPTYDLRTSPTQLDDLAEGIAHDGFCSHAAEAVALANLLHCEGFRQLALDIVRDETQPSIARERAFGLVHGIALQAPQLLHSVAA